jgi:hypothetical protein
MQQRYCSCGCAVWVEYIFSNVKTRTVFWSGTRVQGMKLIRCPRCGKHLDIDELF